jgi:hypothetical protein
LLLTEEIFLNRVWFAVLLGGMLFVVNAFLTYTASFLYHAGAKDHLEYEGVYDPSEVHSKPPQQRLLSPIFLLKLGLLCLMILVGGLVLVRQLDRPEIFIFMLGGFYLFLLADGLIEFRRVMLFRSALHGDGIRGQVVFSKRQVWMEGVLDLYGFVVLYLFVFLLGGGWFFLGGAVTCFISSRRQRDWALVKS